MKRIFVLICCVFVFFSVFSQSKNTSVEVLDYRTVDGKIILELLVNDIKADFVLDINGANAVLPEYVEKLEIDQEVQKSLSNVAKTRGIETIKTMKINKISFGNNIFSNNFSILVLKDAPYLRKLGVAGTINTRLFCGATITLDGKRQKITTSIPYRPPYMRLDYRVDCVLETDGTLLCPVVINGKNYSLAFDSWCEDIIAMSPEDFALFTGKKAGQELNINLGYEAPIKTGQVKVADECLFVKNMMKNVLIPENKSLQRSVLGVGLLKEGILSIDVRRSKMYFQPYDLVKIEDELIPKDLNVKIESGKLNPITGEYFLEHIFDYKKGGDFVLKGDKPVVIDFWASWCGPCMKMLPIMEKLAAKYKDQVIFYKVNADVERELCRVYDIEALPTFFFIPVGGKPIVEVGARPENFESIIQEQLLKKK